MPEFSIPGGTVPNAVVDAAPDAAPLGRRNAGKGTGHSGAKWWEGGASVVIEKTRDKVLGFLHQIGGFPIPNVPLAGDGR